MTLIFNIPFIHNYPATIKGIYTRELERIDEELYTHIAGRISGLSFVYRNIPICVSGNTFKQKVKRIPESNEMYKIYMDINAVKEKLERILWYTSSITSLVGKEYVHPELREQVFSIDCDERKSVIRRHCFDQQHFDFLMSTEDLIDIKIAEDLINAT